MNKSTCNSFMVLADISQELESDSVSEEQAKWDGSPFQWIQRKSSATKGKIGKELVSAFAKRQGFGGEKDLSHSSYRIIKGKVVDIRFSLLWADKAYTFQQIKNQNFEYAFFLGISPQAAHAWFIPKEVLMAGNKEGLSPQHKGKSGRDTFWLRIFPNDPPEWLNQYGGTLDDVYEIISQIK